MAIRLLRHALNEAFDQTRSVGWISQLLTVAGHKAGHVLRHIDTSPLGTVRATKQVVALEKRLRKRWDETLFDEKYVPAVMKEELRYDQHAAFAEWLSHFVDALKWVNWRSGEIRDRALNE